MAYVTNRPHPKAPAMRQTTFACYGCNQTRSYTLTASMAEAYAVACITARAVLAPK